MLAEQKALFSEKSADLLVIQGLLNQISKLKGELPMSKVLIDAKGTLYLAHQYEVITPEELATSITELQEEQANAAALQAQIATPVVSEAPTEAPVDSTPTEPVAPEAPSEQSVPDVAAEQPANDNGQDDQPAAPAEAPAQPEQPAEAQPQEPVTLQ